MVRFYENKMKPDFQAQHLVTWQANQPQIMGLHHKHIVMTSKSVVDDLLRLFEWLPKAYSKHCDYLNKTLI